MTTFVFSTIVICSLIFGSLVGLIVFLMERRYHNQFNEMKTVDFLDKLEKDPSYQSMRRQRLLEQKNVTSSEDDVSIPMTNVFQFRKVK